MYKSTGTRPAPQFATRSRIKWRDSLSMLPRCVLRAGLLPSEAISLRVCFRLLLSFEAPTVVPKSLDTIFVLFQRSAPKRFQVAGGPTVWNV